MTYLALDLARQSGWAAGKPCGLPVYGTFRLRGIRDAARFLELGRIVAKLIREHEATAVVIEEPFIGNKLNRSALLPLFGYRASAMMAAESLGLLVTTASPATVRKSFIGTGGQRRKDAKAGVTAKCEWLGHKPRTEDEADALALWHYRCSIADPAHFAMMMRRGSFGSNGGDSHERQSTGASALAREGPPKDRP